MENMLESLGLGAVLLVGMGWVMASAAKPDTPPKAPTPPEKPKADDDPALIPWRQKVAAAYARIAELEQEAGRGKARIREMKTTLERQGSALHQANATSARRLEKMRQLRDRVKELEQKLSSGQQEKKPHESENRGDESVVIIFKDKKDFRRKVSKRLHPDMFGKTPELMPIADRIYREFWASFDKP